MKTPSGSSLTIEAGCEAKSPPQKPDREDLDMADKNNGGFLGFFSFGKKKMSPDQLMEELRHSNVELNESLWGLEFDLKRLRKDRDRAIQRGTKAARSKDGSLVREAAMDIKMLKAEMASVEQGRSTALKSRLVCRTTLRQMEMASSGGALEVAGRVSELLSDPEVHRMVTANEYTEERFAAELDRKIHMMMSGLEERIGGVEDDISDEERALFALAEAEVDGDESTANRYLSSLTGDESESIEDPELNS